MSADQLYPGPVRDGSSTVVAVYATLDRAGPMTYDDLKDELGASRRAVEAAVADLRAADLVEATPDAAEPCRKRWRVA